MALTLEQLKLAFDAFRNFGATASEYLFEEIFGKEMADHYWYKYTETYHCNIAGFYGYLDDAYKEALLNYILKTVIPKLEAASK